MTFTPILTPNIFNTATATAAGDTAVWAPASGKKFRLMKYAITMTADAATIGGADLTVTLRDATTALPCAISVFVPAVAGTVFGTGVDTPWVDLGAGILSGAINRVLNVNLSAALSTGLVRVTAAGIEE